MLNHNLKVWLEQGSVKDGWYTFVTMMKIPGAGLWGGNRSVSLHTMKVCLSTIILKIPSDYHFALVTSQTGTTVMHGGIGYDWNLHPHRQQRTRNFQVWWSNSPKEGSNDWANRVGRQLQYLQSPLPQLVGCSSTILYFPPYRFGGSMEQGHQQILHVHTLWNLAIFHKMFSEIQV